MSSYEASRRCYTCKKFFCCADCRKRHENKKHPNRPTGCPLCLSEKLPLQIFEDKALLCHIVINHLPLYCCLCGDIFKESKDLENFGTCKWWHSRRRHSLISNKKAFLTTPSPLPNSSNVKVQEQSTLESDYNANFRTLTSPPELYRNTSTPMQVGLTSQKGTFDFKTPSVPNFSLKTPKTNSPSLTNNPSRSNLQFTNSISKDSNSTSIFFTLPMCDSNHEITPFRSLPSLRSNRNEQLPESDHGRILDVMEEQDETTHEKEEQVDNQTQNHSDMDLTDVEGGVLPDTQSLELNCEKMDKPSESVKKVRFSDQYENQPERISNVGFNMTEEDEYYEARDSFVEFMENRRLGEESQETSLDQSDIKITRDNDRNAEKENSSPKNGNVIIQQQTSSSSRVVMMLVVENNSSLNPSNLTPLIDSGLKKLEEHVASSNFFSGAPNACGKSPIESNKKVVSSVDSYISVESVESVTSTDLTGSRKSQYESTSSLDDRRSTATGGILSAVAQAVRYALKNFSGGSTSKAVTEEQIMCNEEVVSKSSTSEIVRTSGVASRTSSVFHRPGKRPRDIVDTSSSSSRQADSVAMQVDSTSPLAKRHRGWYRIKGREPIARMRNNRLTSPRGVSSETQVFRQGSLLIGDTVLPIPTRAHQSTQTD